MAQRLEAKNTGDLGGFKAIDASGVISTAESLDEFSEYLARLLVRGNLKYTLEVVPRVPVGHAAE